MHARQYLGWAAAHDFGAHAEDAKTLLDELRRRLDLGDQLPRKDNQFLWEHRQYLTDATQRLPHQCPLCCKNVELKKKYRHGTQCLYTKKLASQIYPSFRHNKRYWCLLCAANFSNPRGLVLHLGEHDMLDLRKMGMSRLLLHRRCQNSKREQEELLRVGTPQFQLRSASSAAYFSSAYPEWDWMDTIGQEDCYGACLDHICRTDNKMEPPWVPVPARCWPWRVLGENGYYYFRCVGGYYDRPNDYAVENIIYQVKLLGQRRFCPSFQYYEVTLLQKQGRNYSFQMHTLG